ncbi:MAG: 16S rRNA (cytosine(1402)-N(4))-methyltransferase RsmH [Candidatus Daviesbacteria bacterium]|nr:16S rRNA (cytosine(1402)-N(4))-methyltransferase RsmH [Candidatus Daviesbacteria bacterium]
MKGYHESVLLTEAIKALDIKIGEWYLDLTLGDGGHSEEIERQGGKVVGIDVDPQALKRAKERLKGAILVQGNFRDIENLISSQTELKDKKFAGAIFDLGVSSLQLETPERGFSFGKEGPLDMRMDLTLGVTALDLLKVLSEKELYELFKSLGEEKYSKLVARALVRAGKITTTTDLARIVEKVVGRQGKIHPATKIFQALRMVVNDELGALKEGLEEVSKKIQENGRLVVISFHSLEDRIVKNTFKGWEQAGLGKILTKKPIAPGVQEIAGNPRSRSAKMRVFEIL